MIVTSFKQKVYDTVKMIPKGRVSTYGQIAMLIGNPRASRAVGNALHVNPDPDNTPCFRVVNGEGYLSGAFAFGGIDVQKKMLEKDGIRVEAEPGYGKYRVDLGKYLWKPQIIQSGKISCLHAFSTRLGGVSSGIYDSLNLGINTGDDDRNVRMNWEIFLRACGISEQEYVYGLQAHENKVLIVGEEDKRPPCAPVPEKYHVDGYVTNRKNVPLAVFTADCVPVLMQDKKAKVIAAVHCGWRSTAGDIEKEAVKAMVSLGAHPENICAAIGPAIEKECFETGRDVADAMYRLIGDRAAGFIKEHGTKENKDCSQKKYLTDLKGIVKERLIMLGLKEKNIEVIKACTMCEPGRFWSHRYTKGQRGSQASVIML